MFRESCADRIKLALEIRKMTQSDLCRKTGISKATVSQYTSGKYEPGQERTEIIANALDVSEAWLMGFDAQMDRDLQVVSGVNKVDPIDAETWALIELLQSRPEIKSLIYTFKDLSKEDILTTKKVLAALTAKQDE